MTSEKSRTLFEREMPTEEVLGYLKLFLDNVLYEKVLKKESLVYSKAYIKCYFSHYYDRYVLDNMLLLDDKNEIILNVTFFVDSIGIDIWENLHINNWTKEEISFDRQFLLEHGIIYPWVPKCWNVLYVKK